MVFLPGKARNGQENCFTVKSVDWRRVSLPLRSQCEDTVADKADMFWIDTIILETVEGGL